MKNDKCDELDASLAEELRGSLLFGYIPVVPLAFLGLGIYRAWIEIAFVGTFVPFPFSMATPRDLFDSIMVLTVVLCAIFAKKLKTLVGRRSALTITGILLTTSTVLSFSAFYAPNIATELGTASGIVGGVGIAFMIVIWSEIYGSLNPFRVAAYYSLSIVAGALVIYVYEGFKFEWLFVMTALLPLVSLLCAHSALLHIPKSDRPARREATEFSHTLESSIPHGGIRIRLWPARNELLFRRIRTALVARNALRRTRDFSWRMHSRKTLRFRAYLPRGAAHHRGGIPAASRIQPISANR